MMRIRVPDYYEKFHCLARECPHTCCEKWEVVIDAETAHRYLETSGSLGERLREALRRDENGVFCFSLDGGRCPFLDESGLCEIHCQLGEAATSITCREHPRFIEEYGPFREITLSASCPAVNSLLLETEKPLTFLEWDTAEPEEPGDDWLPFLLPLRNRMLAVLQDRTKPLRVRLRSFLTLAENAQVLLDADIPEELPRMAVEWCFGTKAEGAAVLSGGLDFLGTLEELDPDWKDLLKQAETAEAVPVSENLLDRIAVYVAFRYLLKTVNDGDLVSRAELCVFAVLVIERLAAVCGLAEALRRFSCEIEHSNENLHALQAAFRRGKLEKHEQLFQ